MPVTPIRFEAMRRTETPNAAMTTIASPTQGPTNELSVWKVNMRARQQGPRHMFDSEQIWLVLDGEIEIAVDDKSLNLLPGDAVVITAREKRQITAVIDASMIVCGRGDAVVSVPGEAEARGTPPWVS